MLIDTWHALGLAAVGRKQEALAASNRAAEQLRAANLLGIQSAAGIIRARALRMLGGVDLQHELESQVSETLAVIVKTEQLGWMPHLLLERAGLAKLCGDADGMARDLAEARRRFAEMGVTGWDDYARSIEA